MLSDLRFAFRQLAKAPGFAATIVLTLALGIGACTAIFSAIDTLVLRPFDDPGMARNVRLLTQRTSQQSRAIGSSLPDMLDWEQQCRSLESISAFAGTFVNLTGGAEPLRLEAAWAGTGYLEIMGIKALHGRTFAPDEFRSGNDKVLVLGYRFWQRAFGGKADMVGRAIEINGEKHTVVGIAAEQRFITGNRDVWMPLSFDGPNAADRMARTTRAWTVVARMRPGATIEQVQAEFDLVSARLAEKFPDSNKGYGVRVTSQWDFANRGVSWMLQLLFGAVVSVLLIACANVANLLLARAFSRQREMSVRAAIGASRVRIVRQVLTESLVLALLGGTLGVLFAQWGVDFIRSAVPGSGVATGMERLMFVKLNPVVLGFALGLSLVTALLFGFLPALVAAHADVNETLKQATRGSSGSRGGARWRNAFVAVEIALALSLLGSTGLLIRSFVNRTAVDLGFEPSRAGFLDLTLRTDRYATPETTLAFAEAVVANLRTVRGIEAAGFASAASPLAETTLTTAFEVEGWAPTTMAERPAAKYGRVSPDFFSVLGIRLRDGRFFLEHDIAKAPRVAIINEALAREFFPNENPLGRRLRMGSPADPWREIVGVVDNVASAEIGEPPRPQIYEPLAQVGSVARRMLTFVVRANVDWNSHLVQSLKAQVYAVDKDQPIGDVSTFGETARRRLASHRLTVQLLLTLAGIALVIAVVGIYGVVAYSVGQRTLEFGIRVALGAQSFDVMRLVMGQGVRLIGAGIVLGLAGVLLAGRVLQSRLFQISAQDPATLGGVALLFAAVAALACWLPARRATKVDPIVALRAE